MQQINQAVACLSDLPAPDPGKRRKPDKKPDKSCGPLSFWERVIQQLLKKKLRRPGGSPSSLGQQIQKRGQSRAAYRFDTVLADKLAGAGAGKGNRRQRVKNKRYGQAYAPFFRYMALKHQVRARTCQRPDTRASRVEKVAPITRVTGIGHNDF
jgi:hypothetical protein